MKRIITPEEREIARWALEEIKRLGAQAARIVLYGGSGTSYELRDLQIDKLQQSTEKSFSAHLFVDGRYSSVSTNRIDKKELTSFLRQGVETTRLLAEDLNRQLPDPRCYYKGGGLDLQLADESFYALSADERLQWARAVGEEVYQTDPRIVSVTSFYGDSVEENYIVDSHGFEGEGIGTQFSLGAQVSIKGDNDARPEGVWYDLSIDKETLIRKGLGKIALERALRKLGAQKIASGQFPMVVDAIVSSRLLSPIISALQGAALQQRSSFLIDKLNQPLFQGSMQLIDEPHRVRTIGARLFDGEGVATYAQPIVEHGELRTYFIDTYQSGKLKMPATISGPSVLVLKGSEQSQEALLRKMDKGIFVTGFNGGNCNPTTGDFSYGIEGFWVENGVIRQPINEMNITGNMIDLWAHLTDVANDPVHYSSWKVPSLLFEGVNFSGL